jgi:DNA polymerase III epsilon subunit-like protein
MATLRMGMNHLNGHLLCAIDCETTGNRPGFHDMIQICVLPLDYKLDPWKEFIPFYTALQLKRPENISEDARMKSRLKASEAQLHGLDPWRAADLFEEWFEKLKLAPGKRIVPLAHNWVFDRGFIIDWLGEENFRQFFDGRYRDTMVSASFMNDRADFHIEPYPYPKVNLEYLASTLKIPHGRAHDALGDCLTTAAVYKQIVSKYA